MVINRPRLTQLDANNTARLALIFGGKAAEDINLGRDPYHAARLAASYAQRVQVITGLHGACGPVIGAILRPEPIDLHALAERMRREEADEDGPTVTCAVCDGTGIVNVTYNNDPDRDEDVTCDACGGTGRTTA
jgi:hypothetical protein